jgi:hypothetical protein
LKNSLTRYELLERPIYKQNEEKREKKYARKPNLADQEIKCPKSGKILIHQDMWDIMSLTMKKMKSRNEKNKMG